MGIKITIEIMNPKIVEFAEKYIYMNQKCTAFGRIYWDEDDESWEIFDPDHYREGWIGYHCEACREDFTESPEDHILAKHPEVLEDE